MDFGDLLAKALDAAGYKQLSFAKKMSTSQGFIGDIIRGRRNPPLDKLEAWAAELKLRGAERDAFMRAGMLAHCPESVRGEFLKLSSRVERLEKTLAEYEKRHGAGDKKN
jgi:transcriptional regulator with XRE-family HTH domain